MRKNEKGFGVLEILLIVIVIGLIVVVGWLFIDRQKAKDGGASKTTNTQQTTQKNTEQKSTQSTNETPKQIDTAIHEVDIKLQTEADISKLPSYVPESFRTYMLDTLKNNKPDKYGCINIYSVSKLSVVNVYGGVENGGVQVPTENCPGTGSSAIWAVTPSGTWEQIGTQYSFVCNTPGGGKVYKEFSETCRTVDQPIAPVPNPNGSIISLNN